MEPQRGQIGGESVMPYYLTDLRHRLGNRGKYVPMARYGTAGRYCARLMSFMAGKNHARSRSMAAKARAKANQAGIAARAHRQPSDILKRMRERGL